MSICGLIIGWRIRSGVADAAVGYGLMFAFSFAMIWVGVLLGSRLARGRQGVAFVVLFPLTFIASTFVPIETLPGVLQDVAEWNPVTTMAEALRELFGNPGGGRPATALADPPPAGVHPDLDRRPIVVCAPLAVRPYDRRTAE